MHHTISPDQCKQVMLEMLVEIDSFCRDHNIQYFLTGGTLLGAIRHQGFIPWDDDIDIALKRSDYERLIKEFHSKTGDIEILDFRNKKNYIWPAAKIINKKTILIENGIEKATIGLYIDMFPLDYIAGDYDEAKQFVKRVNTWKNILTLKYLRVSKERTMVKNAVVIMSRIVLRFVPDAVILKKIHSLCLTFDDNDNCNYLCNLVGAWGTKEIVEKTVFEKPIDHVFENKTFSIPVGYDDLLRSLYGNYMELPPVEKRVSTHTASVSWK